MTFNSKYIQAALICFAALLGTSCSNDDVVVEQGAQYLQMVSPSISSLQTPVVKKVMTRGDGNSFVPGTENSTTPEGVPDFFPYNDLYPTPINPDYTTIGTFLAEEGKNQYMTTAGLFRYERGNYWTSTVTIKPNTANYVFGYMPSNTGSTLASISKREGSSTWADGAVMSLHNLPSATPADVCVVVGVLKADVPESKPDDWFPAPINDPEVVSRISQGVYAYDSGEKDNYVYLLLEHIYANINVELSVEEKYAELRNIVLKDVFVRTKVPSLVDCELKLCNDPKKPIEERTFTYATGAETSTRARLFSDSDVFLMKTTPTSIPVYFSPYLPDQGFDYEFHYDVYDKKGIDAEHPYGNLVRENCVAVNHWRIQGYSVEAGKSFKATVVIRPTYLYMLSEPDLDNPSFELDD